MLDTFKEQMGLRVGEHREEGKCIYGQGMEIKAKNTFEERDKKANILLMLPAFITSNPYLLSPIPTSKKKPQTIPFRKHHCRSRGSWQRLLALLPKTA